jgi:hypothetical protein
MKPDMPTTKLPVHKDGRLKAGSETAKLRADKTLATGGCPICAALKEFQSYFSKHLRAYECGRFCNLHAWVVANSSPAESVAAMFLESMRNPRWRPSSPNPSDCDFCKRMEIEKQIRFTEIIEEFDESKLREWLGEHGMLCFRHGRELIQKLPEPLDQAVEENMSQKAGELEQQLRVFLQQAKKGDHAGGGILGRAAEYLVAQRGIES